MHLSGSQFSYFFMANHSQRLKKLKEITKTKGGGHGYTHIRRWTREMFSQTPTKAQ